MTFRHGKISLDVVMQISRPSSAVTPSATSFSRPSSSSIPTFSRPSSAESFSRQTLTTPIPEVLVVAENLNSLKYQENLSNYQGILNPGHQQNVDEYQGTNKSFQGTEGKYQVGNVCNESYLQKKKPEYKQQLKRKIREKLPDEWDLESTSSLESNLFTLNDNLRTISHLITKVFVIKLEPSFFNSAPSTLCLSISIIQIECHSMTLESKSRAQFYHQI